jgi:putative hydrolase of the HAD superfamily
VADRPGDCRRRGSWHAWLAANAPKVAQAFSVAELRVRRMALLERRPELVADLYQLRREALAEVFAELGEDPAHIDGAMQHFAVQRNPVVPFADVLPVLPLLQGMLRLGVVTNGNADLEVIGMDHHFSMRCRRRSLAAPSPIPASSMPPARRWAWRRGCGLRRRRPAAGRAGRASAGLRAVWMNRHGSTAHLEAGVTPDAICATFDELLAWIRGQMQDSRA